MVLNYEYVSVLGIHAIARMAIAMKIHLNSLGQIFKVLLKYFHNAFKGQSVFKMHFSSCVILQTVSQSSLMVSPSIIAEGHYTLYLYFKSGYLNYATMIFRMPFSSHIM